MLLTKTKPNTLDAYLELYHMAIVVIYVHYVTKTLLACIGKPHVNAHYNL